MPQTNLFLITGDDEAQISAEADKIVRDLVEDPEDPFALDNIQEGEGSGPAEVLTELLNSLASPPFFGGSKTIWLKNFSAFKQVKEKSPLGKLPKQLTEKIQEGIPEDINLVLSGPNLEENKKLFKAIKEQGKITQCRKPNIRDRKWQQHMADLIRGRADAENINLTDEVIQYLVDVLGTDTAAIDPELNKLIAYAGEKEQITLEAAQEICQGIGETVPWALQNAIGERDLDMAVGETRRLLASNGSNIEGVCQSSVLQIADFIRQLLQIRVCMQQLRIKLPKQLKNKIASMATDEKNKLLEQGFGFVNSHPYRIQRLAESACNYSGQELVNFFPELRDANVKCVASSVPNQLILEDLIIRIVQR